MLIRNQQVAGSNPVVGSNAKAPAGAFALELLIEIRTCEWTSEACPKGTPEKAGGWRSQTWFESRPGGTDLSSLTGCSLGTPEGHDVAWGLVLRLRI